jgi:hypothetical protein
MSTIGLAVSAVAIPLGSFIDKHKHLSNSSPIIGLLISFIGAGLSLASLPHTLVSDKLPFVYYYIQLAISITLLFLQFQSVKKKLVKKMKYAYYTSFAFANYIFACAGIFVFMVLPYAPKPM